MTKIWEIRGKKLVEDLQSVTDIQLIESLSKQVVEEIINKYPNLNSRKNPLQDVRKAVSEAFPSTEKQTSQNQYFTDTGKGNIPRYDHLALKFLTFSTEDWNALGDETRLQYQEKLTELTQSNQITSFSLSSMNIEQLELDSETQECVLKALNHSGKTLPEFIQQACKVYANTINGKQKVADTDLTNVLTKDLIDVNNNDYKTHPRKIEELTLRAISAIQKHNDMSTEINQKWFISGTAISELTGSRVQAINEVLKKRKTMLDDHHLKHGLTPYTNRRGRNISDDIHLAELVPDGTYV